MENTGLIESPELKAALENYTTFLAEARRRLIFTLCVFGVATIAGFLFYEKIIKFLIGTLSLKGINIVFTSPFQFINLAISCGIAVGIIVSFPLLVIQILSFLRPALRRKEFKMLIRFLPFSLFLFLLGLAFGFLIMKWQIKIFLDRSVALGIGNVLDISSLLTTVLITSALMGIGFEFPILLILLLRLGIVKRQKLTKIRHWVYLGSFIFAMLLPPDSILADVLLTLPLIILFELTLILSRFQKDITV